MKDTADMVKEDPQIWIDSIKKSKPIIDFLVSRLYAEEVDERAKIKRIGTEILPFVPDEGRRYINPVLPRCQ
jgi:hypothetical protein